MLGDAYTLEYLPLFDEELAEAARYITYELRNPDAAMKLIADVEFRFCKVPVEIRETGLICLENEKKEDGTWTQVAGGPKQDVLGEQVF